MKNLNVVCYGVRPAERSLFQQLNVHGFNLKLVEDLLNETNYAEAKGMDAIIVRGNCLANRMNIERFAQFGIRFLLTRTVGTNHIDLMAAHDHRMQVAYVPFYSPNAIAELSVTLAMMLLRRTTHTTNKTAAYNFTIDRFMFSKEVRNCTVGIVGVGNIGLTEAKLFKGLGATVIGNDLYPSEEAKAFIEFKSLDDLLAESDIVSIHIPYIPGKNERFINKDFIEKMKDDAILINTARGELQDNQAILDALTSKKLSGFGTDVLPNEALIFNKNFDEDPLLIDATAKALIDMYPRVIITPHIGSNTDEAVSNMIETSFDNLYKMFNQLDCANTLPTQAG